MGEFTSVVLGHIVHPLVKLQAVAPGKAVWVDGKATIVPRNKKEKRQWARNKLKRERRRAK